MKLMRTGLAAAFLGAAVWAVFLLSLKGFFPFLDTGTSVRILGTALLLALAGAAACVTIWAYGDPGTRNTVLASSILSATASCMLFVTLSAIAAPLTLAYDLTQVLLAMIGGTLVFSVALTRVRQDPPRRRIYLPMLLIAMAISLMDIASLSAILPFTEWETASATPGALALQPMTVVFLSEAAAVLVLTRAGAQVDKRAAARTREENERLRQLTDSTFEGLVVHRDGRVVDANIAFCAMAGLPLTSVKDRSLGDFSLAFQTSAGERPVETEFQVAGGEPIPVEVLSRDIDLGDGRVQVTAVRDIRERRAAEQSTRDRQRVAELQRETEEAQERQRIAEEASRAKSAFLAMMSHEIRTPMNAVIGLASTLLDEALTHDQKHAVAAIKTSGDNLLRTLNDILDFSRLDAGRMTFEYGPFCPAQLTHETISVHGPGAAEAGLRLTASLDSDLPARLIGDAGRIRQVLHNLMSNAIKFTKQGGVEIAERVVARDKNKVTIEWSVRDTGIGIGPDKLGRLFDAFVQADNSISRRFGGSGLGLAISKQLIEQMGGTISVTSSLDAGSTFRVRLTLAVAEEVLISEQNPEPVDLLAARIERLGRPLKILLAEDNATNSFVFTRMVRDTAIDLEIAVNGVEAVTRAERSAYDLICMDMSMPEMDGLDATRAIRAGLGPCRAVPIIALTANAFPEDVEACRKAGMNDFVSKPISRTILFGAILRAMPAVVERAAA